MRVSAGILVFFIKSVMNTRTKKDSHPFGWLSFCVMAHRIEEGGGSCETSAKKCPVGIYSLGEGPFLQAGIQSGRWLE